MVHACTNCLDSWVHFVSDSNYKMTVSIFAKQSLVLLSELLIAAICTGMEEINVKQPKSYLVFDLVEDFSMSMIYDYYLG